MSTKTIRRNFKINGVLTDALTAKLSDPTGAYGVKRNDTSAAVVADGTNLTRISTGVYEYTFTAVDGVAYTAWVEYTYGENTYRFEHDFDATTSVDDVTLGVFYSSLRREVGRYLGYSRDPDRWTSDQVLDVFDIIQSGLRQFYTPPVLPGDRYSHEWSFLCPKKTLTTVSGQCDYDLPADFGMLEGPLVLVIGESTAAQEIEIASEYDVRLELAGSPPTGWPTKAAICPKDHDATVGTRYEMSLSPTPNSDYSIIYRYRVNPQMIDATNVYPPGGDVHSETILESCLTIAESRMNDEDGIHASRFMQRLAASISHDKMFACPNRLGYNADRSDNYGSSNFADCRYRTEQPVTYKGVTY